MSEEQRSPVSEPVVDPATLDFMQLALKARELLAKYLTLLAEKLPPEGAANRWKCPLCGWDCDWMPVASFERGTPPEPSPAPAADQAPAIDWDSLIAILTKNAEAGIAKELGRRERLASRLSDFFGPSPVEWFRQKMRADLEMRMILQDLLRRHSNHYARTLKYDTSLADMLKELARVLETKP